jgi:hypothetical protein
MKIKNIIQLVIVSVVLVTIVGCERDDICPPGTPTTPKLIIEFFDVEDSEENKSVVDLSFVPGESTDTIPLGNTDSIALPLDTNANSSRFKLIRNTGDTDFENTDEVEFIYQVNDIYINRACSFKAVYNDLSAIRIPETPLTNNWIRSIIVEQLDVEDEQVTHVSILH